MAYIGSQPTVGNFQACDAITTSATTTFNLLVGGVAISPQSAQHCLVSLNGVLQAPISSYTISGSTIIFAAALTTDDVIDFITVLGDVLDLGVPSDDTVGAAQIKADLISGTTALAAEPADTDEFLVSDAGVLKRIDYSLIKGSPNTPAFEAKRTGRQTVSDNTHTKLAAGTEVFDSDGTYDHSTNYRFTPAVAGKYFIYGSIGLGANDNSALGTGSISIYKNGSAYQTFHNDYSSNSLNLNWVHIHATIDLDADDYVELYGNVNTSASNPFFEGINSNVYQSTFGGYKIVT